MNKSTSKQLIFHLICNLFIPVSHSYSTSPYITRKSSWKSELPTTATSSYADNSYITTTYQTRSSSLNSKWLTTASSSQDTQETTRMESNDDKATTADSANITERQHKVSGDGTLFSNENETSLSTTNAHEMTSQSYLSTGIKNESSYKQTTISPLATDVTSKNDRDKLFEMDTCAPYSTCELVSNYPFEFCRCDELCSTYKDCCMNFQNQQTNDTNGMDYIECTPYTYDSRRDGIFAIARCPDNIDETDDVSQKCQSTDLLTVGPMVVDDAGIVYRNKYCAECHNKTNLRPFWVKFSNVPSGILDEIVRMNETTLVILQRLILLTSVAVLEQVPPKRHNVRRCIQYIPGSEACLDFYTSPVITKDGIYRNQFCIPTELEPFGCLGYNFNQKYLQPDYDYHDAFALSVMFSFGNTDQDCVTQVSGLCLGQEIYRGYKLITEFVLTSNVVLSEFQQQQFLLFFLWILPSDVRIDNFDASPAYISNSSMNVDLNIALTILREMEGKQMLVYKSMLENLLCTIVVQRSKAEPIRIHIKKTRINYDENKTMMRLFSYRFVSDNETKLANISISAEKKDTACIQNFAEGELIDNTSLVILHLKCKEDMLYRTSTENDKIKIFLTYAGMSISVLALVGSIIIHRRLGMHTSIPGSNVENLSVSLLLSNVMFVCGIGANDYQNICHMVGVALHYLWLAVFSFMSISMVNMFHDLRKMSLITKVAQKSKTKAAFTIFGLLLPVIFVAPGVILDQVGINGLYSQYDGNVCFPTGYPAAVIFVSCPIGLSILVNVTCFIGIVVVLTKHSIDCKNIRKSSAYQNLSVYARLSIVTGLFWTTGLLGIVIPNDTVEYLFIICCSLQGFFVAVCNVTTRHVIRQVKEHFQKSHD